MAGGLHGSNRLGGNSLGDILVFGKRAGEYAAEYAKTVGSAPVIADAQVAEAQSDALRFLAGDGDATGENPYLLHEALQDAMQDDAGIARDQQSLTRSLEAILELQERAKRMRVGGGRVLNPGWHSCMDVVNMLTVSEAIVRSALERKESRGSQWRLDYPDLSEEQGRVNYAVYRDGELMRIRAVPLEPIPVELSRHLEDG